MARPATRFYDRHRRMPLYTRRREAGPPPSVPLLVAAVTFLLFTPVSSQVATQPAEATLRIIVVETADEARIVKERLAQGEDFAELAKALSVDPSADAGGLPLRREQAADEEVRSHRREMSPQVQPGGSRSRGRGQLTG